MFVILNMKRFGHISHLSGSNLTQWDIIITDQIEVYKLKRQVDFKNEKSFQNIQSLTMDCSPQLDIPNYWQAQKYTEYCLILSNQYPLKVYCVNFPILTVYYPKETCPSLNVHCIYLLTFTVEKGSGKLTKIDVGDSNHPHYVILLKKKAEFINEISFQTYHVS